MSADPAGPGVPGGQTPQPSQAPQTTGPVLTWQEFAGPARNKIIKYVTAMTGDHTLAEDVAQETLIIAWSKWEQVAGHPRPFAWALLVARRMTAKLRAREQRQDRIAAKIAADRDHPLVSGGLGSERPEQAVCERDAVLTALAQLPRHQREVIILCYLGDMTHSDVAAVLEIRVGTVKAHAYQGRAKLRRLLGS